MESNSKLDNSLVSFAILTILILIVVGLWMWLPGYLTKDINDLSAKAQFGDSYGSVSALFTGLAFGGLIFTILLQQRQIKLQRDEFLRQFEEMKMSREEITRQVSVQEKHLALGLAELKMKSLETKMAEIEMQGLQWVESARYGYVGPALKKVKEEMDSLIEDLERNVAGQ